MKSDRPIRILSLTYADDGQQNAQQQNAREITRRLDHSRFEVTLLTEGRGPCSIAKESHVRLIHLPRRLRSVRIFLALLGGSYDILFHPHAGLPERVYSTLPRWFPGRGTRVIVSVEGDQSQLDEVPGWIRGRLEHLYQRADLLVSITEHVRSTLEARTGRSGPVIPVGVDLQKFRPRDQPRSPGPLRVLSVGTVKGWKRPELVRLAARELPELHFRWVGAGELLEQERAAAPPNLDFAGAIDHGALADAYREADILLHPSRMEGMPKVILEALASGLPVIAFHDYQPRYLEEGGAGFVVQTPTEMLSRLQELRASEELRTRMSRAARALAGDFSWEAVAAQWELAFEEQAAVRRG